MKRSLCFDDVLLVPQYSDIETRSIVDLSVTGINETFAQLIPSQPHLRCPIVGSPMDTVMSPSAAAVLDEYGGFGILHRYCTIQESVELYLDSVIKSTSHVPNVMVAIGATGDYLERAEALYSVGCRNFCIDVAHGHHLHVKDALSTLRDKFGSDIHIMSGNVAIIEAFNDLADWGANSIRVGIGGGSMCSTRIRTGHGVPTFQSIVDCAQSDRNVLLIADGGIRNSGDIVKSLAAGADMVMLGSLLAGHTESPGDTVDKNGHACNEAYSSHTQLFKKFRGMASKEAQINWRGKVSVVEGESTMIQFKGSLGNTLTDLIEGIKSGLSYSGARTIQELQTRAKFIEVTSQGVRENSPHGVSGF